MDGCIFSSYFWNFYHRRTFRRNVVTFTLQVATTIQCICLLINPFAVGAGTGESPGALSIDTFRRSCCGIESSSTSASSSSSSSSSSSVNEQKCSDLLRRDMVASDVGATDATNENGTTLRNIFIGGLFPLTGPSSTSTNGRLDLEAACMALNHVNEERVIDGYQIVMYFNDTQCDTGVGVDALYDQLYRKPIMSMLLGCSCSEVSKRVAQIIPYWNLVMVSYGSTSVALTDQEYYPTFFRTVTPDSSHNAARASFIDNFGWNTVASLSQEQELFSLAQTKMSKYFESSTNITVSSVLSFVDDPGPQMQQLQDEDARIIIGSFAEDAARAVFCEAYRREMYGPKYVWMLVGWYSRDWWLVDDDRVECDVDQLAAAVEGYFAVDSMDMNVDDRRSVSGLTSKEFRSLMRERGVEHLSPHAAQTYDAIWTVTLALKEAMDKVNSPPSSSTTTTTKAIDATTKTSTISKKITMPTTSMMSTIASTTTSNGSVTLQTNTAPRPLGSSYDDEVMKDALIGIMSDVRFTGVSGPVSFNGPDRFGITTFRQNQGGELNLVAFYFPETEQLDFDKDGTVPIIWAGGFLPVDQILVVEEPIQIGNAAFLTVTVLTVLGMVLAIFFLAFNVKYRKTKYIKLSSPNLNNLLVVGCIFNYSAILMMGLDGKKVSSAVFAPLCTIRTTFLAVGFSLAFGSMFVKTYRVYHIITHATSRVIKRKMLHESTLFLMIGILLLLDVIIITLWVIFDPMYREERRLAIQVSEDGSRAFEPVIEECTSKHQSKWLVSLYSYKGLLLLFGVFLAWETRKVKIPALNDSHYIAVCVYNVVLMSVLAVVVNNWVTQGNSTMSFMLVSLCVFITVTATLCLLFVPKLHAIRLSASNDPVTRSVGLEVKGRTRRFVVDESTELKESIYRAEIHIRAFRREKRKLDTKIAELEGILRMLDREEQYRLGNLSEFDMDSSGREQELQMLLHLPETPIDNEESKRFEQEYRKIVTDSNQNPVIKSSDSIGSRSGVTIEARGGVFETKPKIGKTEARRRVLPFKGVSSENSFTHTPLIARFSTDTDETVSDICPDLDTEKSTVIERTYGTLKEKSSLSNSSESLSEKLRGITDAADRERNGALEDDFDSRDDSQELSDEMTALARRRSAGGGMLGIAGGGGGADVPSTSKEVEEENLNSEEKTLITEMQDLQLRLLQLNGKANMIYYV